MSHPHALLKKIVLIIKIKVKISKINYINRIATCNSFRYSSLLLKSFRLNKRVKEDVSNKQDQSKWQTCTTFIIWQEYIV